MATLRKPVKLPVIKDGYQTIKVSGKGRAKGSVTAEFTAGSKLGRAKPDELENDPQKRGYAPRQSTNKNARGVQA